MDDCPPTNGSPLPLPERSWGSLPREALTRYGVQLVSSANHDDKTLKITRIAEPANETGFDVLAQNDRPET